MPRDRFSASEFAFVICLAFGSAIVTSIASLLQGSPVGRGHAFGESHLYGVVVWELLCLPLVLAFLHWRGWRASDFPLGLGKPTTILGIVIAFSTWIFGWLVDWVFEALFSIAQPDMDLWRAMRPTHAPSLVAIYICRSSTRCSRS